MYYLSRIGLIKAHDRGQEYARINWVVEDDDCQMSSPQLVDLGNGRFLMGYAKFQCISEGEGYDRYNGGDEVMLPHACYLMEVDADGNRLTNPVELPGHCWGALDEPKYLGNGQVGWVYKRNPLREGYSGPFDDTWEMLVYKSASYN